MKEVISFLFKPTKTTEDFLIKTNNYKVIVILIILLSYSISSIATEYFWFIWWAFDIIYSVKIFFYNIVFLLIFVLMVWIIWKIFWWKAKYLDILLVTTLSEVIFIIINIIFIVIWLTQSIWIIWIASFIYLPALIWFLVLWSKWLSKTEDFSEMKVTMTVVLSLVILYFWNSFLFWLTWISILGGNSDSYEYSINYEENIEYKDFDETVIDNWIVDKNKKKIKDINEVKKKEDEFFFNKFKKRRDWIFTFHYQLYWDQLFPLNWIDLWSFIAFNKKFFKDKNWVYRLSSHKWDYEKLETDIKSFRELQDWYMQDDKCIFLWTKCIKKWVDKNIEILIDKKEQNNTFFTKGIYSWLKDLSTVFVNYKWDKNVTSINSLDWRWGFNFSAKDNSEYPHKLSIWYFKEGNYTIYVFFNFADGTTSYNTKKIEVINSTK